MFSPAFVCPWREGASREDETPDGCTPHDGCTPPGWIYPIRMDAHPKRTDGQPLGCVDPTGMHICCWRWMTSFVIVWDQSEEAIMRLATSGNNKNWVGQKCWTEMLDNQFLNPC